MSKQDKLDPIDPINPDLTSDYKAMAEFLTQPEPVSRYVQKPLTDEDVKKFILTDEQMAEGMELQRKALEGKAEAPSSQDRMSEALQGEPLNEVQAFNKFIDVLEDVASHLGHIELHLKKIANAQAGDGHMRNGTFEIVGAIDELKEVLRNREP